MTEVASVVHEVLGPRALELDEPIINYIINVLADEDFDFGFEGEGAFDAVGELLVDSGCVTDDFECRSWSVPAPFLTKTYQMVDDPSMDKVISWNENKTAFVVWKTVDFARDLLPNSFKHSNFSSFIREGFAWVCPVGMVIFLRH